MLRSAWTQNAVSIAHHERTSDKDENRCELASQLLPHLFIASGTKKSLFSFLWKSLTEYTKSGSFVQVMMTSHCEVLQVLVFNEKISEKYQYRPIRNVSVSGKKRKKVISWHLYLLPFVWMVNNKCNCFV